MKEILEEKQQQKKNKANSEDEIDGKDLVDDDEMDDIIDMEHSNQMKQCVLGSDFGQDGEI